MVKSFEILKNIFVPGKGLAVPMSGPSSRGVANQKNDGGKLVLFFYSKTTMMNR